MQISNSTMKICGKKFESFDHTYWKIIKFGVRRKSLFGPCPKGSIDFDFSQSEFFCTKDGYFVNICIIYHVKYIPTKFLEVVEEKTFLHPWGLPKIIQDVYNVLSCVSHLPWKDESITTNSSITIFYSFCCHFATIYEWNFLYLFCKDEITCLLWVLKIYIFFVNISNYYKFFKEKNWYQIQNLL